MDTSLGMKYPTPTYLSQKQSAGNDLRQKQSAGNNLRQKQSAKNVSPDLSREPSLVRAKYDRQLLPDLTDEVDDDPTSALFGGFSGDIFRWVDELGPGESLTGLEVRSALDAYDDDLPENWDDDLPRKIHFFMYGVSEASDTTLIDAWCVWQCGITGLYWSCWRKMTEKRCEICSSKQTQRN